MDDVEVAVKKAKKGDDKAFEIIINYCKEDLYKIAFAYVKNEQEALDIVSETIYTAYMNISGLKNPQFFKTWITKILINCAVAKLKKSNKIIYTNEYENMNDGNDISENEFDISKNIDLYNAIDRLNIKYKNIIILKYFQDMTISQISKLLNYPEGTIKVYLRRALKKLKIELKEECI